MFEFVGFILRGYCGNRFLGILTEAVKKKKNRRQFVRFRAFLSVHYKKPKYFTGQTRFSDPFKNSSDYCPKITYLNIA